MSEFVTPRKRGSIRRGWIPRFRGNDEESLPDEAPAAISRSMKLFLAAVLLAGSATAAPVAHHPRTRVAHPPKTEAAKKTDETQPLKPFFHPSEVHSTGTVTIGGQPIAFDAVAGTLVVHAKDWSDTDALEADADKSDKDKNTPKPEA